MAAKPGIITGEYGGFPTRIIADEPSSGPIDPNTLKKIRPEDGELAQKLLNHASDVAANAEMTAKKKKTVK